jgi:acyl-CoA thioesterase-1
MSVFIRQILLALLLSSITLPAIAEKTILVIGDSLSSAYGMTTDEGWVALLVKKLQENHYHYQVINDSISGDTTSNGLARLPAALDKYNPAITIIELGGNDGLRGIPVNVIEKNLNKMIVAAVDNGSKVLLLAVRLPPNYGPEYTSAFQQVYTNLAAKNKVPTIQMLAKVDMNKQYFQADGIHPIAAAQPLILNNIWTKLVPLLE